MSSMRLYPESTGSSSLHSNITTEHVDFNTQNLDYVTTQLVGSTSWPSGLVLKLTASMDGTNFSDFPSGEALATALGLQATMVLAGVQRIRFTVKTTGGSIVVTPYVVGIGTP